MTRETSYLAAAMAVGTATQFLLGALAPRFADDLGLGPGALGLVLTAMFATGALAAGVAGRVVDRVGPRAAVAATGGSAALALAALAAAQTRTALIVTVLAGGAAMALVNPGTNLAVRSSVPAPGQARAVGWVQAGVQAGALLSGLLAAAAGVIGGWRAAAAVAAALAIGVSLGAGRVPTGSGPAASSGTTTAEARRLVRRLAVFAVLMSTASGAVFAHLTLYASLDLGLPASSAGALPVAFGGAGALARVASGYVVDRWAGPVRVLRLLSVGAVVAVASFLAAPAMPALVWAGALIFGLTGVAWPAVAMTLVVRRVEAAQVGDGSGIVARGLFIGLTIAPAAGGWLAERSGSYAATWVAVVGALVLAVVWAWTALPVESSNGPRLPGGARNVG